MPTLAERRAQVAAQGGAGASGEFIKFKKENESKFLRFLFTDATTIESHKKFWDEDQKKWLLDDACPEGKGSYKITFNCVEYDEHGANPRRVRWEISEYLYNEYLSPYIEKTTPASQNVWEIKVRRPGTMDISYVAFKVEDATELTYPIPEATSQNSSSAPQEAAPTYTNPAPTNTATVPPVSQPTAQPASPVSTPSTAPATARKSKYF